MIPSVDRLRTALAAAFLLLQLAGVARARFVAESWFSWAPHDRQARFEIEARVGGRRLTASELYERYGLPESGWNSHGPADVIDVVREAERRWKGPEARVVVRTRTNGREEESWSWPEAAR